MKNKFEALTAFQSWPKDWQQLCAEFWMEGEEPQEVRFDARQLAIEPPQRAAKVAKEPNCQGSRFTLEELKFAKGGIELGIKDSRLAEDMAKRFGRTKKAFQNYISHVRHDRIDLTTGQKKAWTEAKSC